MISRYLKLNLILKYELLNYEVNHFHEFLDCFNDIFLLYYSINNNNSEITFNTI